MNERKPLATGASPDICDYDGRTALMLATWRGQLLTAGAYTRPLLSSTCAVSDKKHTLNTP